MDEDKINNMVKKETGIRTTIRIPCPVYEKLEEVSLIEARSISSVVTEACMLFLANKKVDEVTDIARKSPEYQDLMKKINQEKQGPDGDLKKRTREK